MPPDAQSPPRDGLKRAIAHLLSGIVFTAAIAMSVLGALVSFTRGRQFYYDSPGAAARTPGAAARTPGGAGMSPGGGPAPPLISPAAVSRNGVPGARPRTTAAAPAPPDHERGDLA